MANSDTSRRGFLDFFTSLLMGTIGLMVAIPAVSYFLSPLRRKEATDGTGPTFLDVGLLTDIPVGEWRLLSLEMVQADGWKKTRTRHAVWVRRQGDGDQGIAVLSSICPHLGCPINWHPNQSEFICPCHGGIFNADGQRGGGPPPRGMDPLEFQVRAGRLFVRWQDFKIGVAERIPVNV